MTDNSTPASVAIALRSIADQMDSFGKLPDLPPVRRHENVRYAAFCREMAARVEFCKALAAVQVDLKMLMQEIYKRFIPLVVQFSFPISKPYRPVVWLEILIAARLMPDLVTPYRGYDYRTLIGEQVEIQLVYEPASMQEEVRLQGRSPLVETTSMRVPRGQTSTQTRESISWSIIEPIRRFRRRTRGLAREDISGLTRFTVRVMTFDYATSTRPDPHDPGKKIFDLSIPPGIETSVFGCSLRRRQHSSNVAGAVAAKVAEVLSGKPPIHRHKGGHRVRKGTRAGGPRQR